MLRLRRPSRAAVLAGARIALRFSSALPGCPVTSNVTSGAHLPSVNPPWRNVFLYLLPKFYVAFLGGGFTVGCEYSLCMLSTSPSSDSCVANIFSRSALRPLSRVFHRAKV